MHQSECPTNLSFTLVTWYDYRRVDNIFMPCFIYCIKRGTHVALFQTESVPVAVVMQGVLNDEVISVGFWYGAFREAVFFWDASSLCLFVCWASRRLLLIICAFDGTFLFVCESWVGNHVEDLLLYIIYSPGSGLDDPAVMLPCL